MALRSLGDELDLPRRRVEREGRIGDVRDVLRMDAPGAADLGDGRVAGGGVIEDGVDHSLIGRPREEVVEVEPPCQLAQHPRRRARLAGRLEGLRHQVEVGVRGLHAHFLQP